MVSVKNVLFGLLFVVIGIGVAGFGVQTGYLQVQEFNSGVETTEATVVSSEVVQDEEQEDDGTEIEYYPRVTYEYTVDGESYTGERIYSRLDRNREPGELEGKEFDDRDRAERVAGRYDPGSTVTVYYFPENPDRSFLVRPEVDWVATGGIVLFGLMFALAGLGAMFSDD